MAVHSFYIIWLFNWRSNLSNFVTKIENFQIVVGFLYMLRIQSAFCQKLVSKWKHQDQELRKCILLFYFDWQFGGITRFSTRNNKTCCCNSIQWGNKLFFLTSFCLHLLYSSIISGWSQALLKLKSNSYSTAGLCLDSSQVLSNLGLVINLQAHSCKSPY